MFDGHLSQDGGAEEEKEDGDNNFLPNSFPRIMLLIMMLIQSSFAFEFIPKDHQQIFKQRGGCGELNRRHALLCYRNGTH